MRSYVSTSGGQQRQRAPLELLQPGPGLGHQRAAPRGPRSRCPAAASSSSACAASSRSPAAASPDSRSNAHCSSTPVSLGASYGSRQEPRTLSAKSR
ncbi:hypothetical protein AB0C33_44535 [Nonomuraea sp. NPDC048881]|uniref:hypothetical protein n=1 Tax=Nonomuraea sp. NPDC048881 TaxID=3155030 RepID=UPI0033EE55A2